MTQHIHAEVVVLGSGPGGYSAAFRAADLGKKVILIEKHDNLGGVCLNVGCIPSKSLLHAAKVLTETKEMAGHGLEFGEPNIDIDKIRAYKDGIVKRLTGGLKMLAKQRKVEIITGIGSFSSDKEIIVKTADGDISITFDNAIIAAGSRSVKLPFLPEDPRIIDSTGALALDDLPKSILIIGGGIIGLEMATVYNQLGSQITIVELMDQLIPGADKDIVRPLERKLKRSCKVMLGTKAIEAKACDDGILVTFEGPKAPKEAQLFDKVLVSVGRVPNGKLIGAKNAGINIDDSGYILVDDELRTNVPHIFAIGDIIGMPMLAHKAVPEGRTAAEIISGKNSKFTPTAIPSVAYTNPEIAWIGLTQTEAIAQDIPHEVGVFPWAACGKSLSMGRNEGITKLIFDPKTEKLLGASIVGPHAGDLISEAALAIAMGCKAKDIASTVHPHPTLSETIMMAAEVFEGTATDIIAPKK